MAREFRISRVEENDFLWHEDVYSAVRTCTKELSINNMTWLIVGRRWLSEASRRAWSCHAGVNETQM